VAAVDYERVVLALKAHLGTKRSHGADELRVRITELEVECSIPEGEEGFDPTPVRPRGTDRPSSAAPANGRGGAVATLSPPEEERWRTRTRAAPTS
jgi:hypothetical protein